MLKTSCNLRLLLLFLFWLLGSVVCVCTHTWQWTATINPFRNRKHVKANYYTLLETVTLVSLQKQMVKTDNWVFTKHSTICPLLMYSPYAAECQRDRERQKSSYTGSEQRSSVTRTSCKSHVDAQSRGVDRMRGKKKYQPRRFSPSNYNSLFWPISWFVLRVPLFPASKAFLSLWLFYNHQSLRLPPCHFLLSTFLLWLPFFKIDKLTVSL